MSLEQIIAWRKRNPDRVKTAGIDFYRRHPDRSLFRNARVRARKKNLPFEITANDIGPLPDQCPLCDGRIVQAHGKLNSRSPTLDQIKPGEGYTLTNIWIICHGCNRKKAEFTVAGLRSMADRIEQKLCSK